MKRKKSKKEIQEEEKSNAEKSNLFDKILKENIAESLIPLINQLFELKLESQHLHQIDESLYQTIERRPDLVRKIVIDDFSAILHIEFQTLNSKEMHLRMMEYCTMLIRMHKMPIYQIVIYIGAKKMTMKNEYFAHNIQFNYNIVSLSGQSYEDFLKSEEPEMVILGILADFGQDEPKEAITKIVEKLQAISEKNQRFKENPVYNKYFVQLSILSKIRDLQPITQKIIDTMALTFKIENDVLYQRGEEKGIEKGEEKTIIKNVLSIYRKVKKINEIAELLDLDIDFVKKIIEQNENK